MDVDTKLGGMLVGALIGAVLTLWSCGTAALVVLFASGNAFDWGSAFVAAGAFIVWGALTGVGVNLALTDSLE